MEVLFAVLALALIVILMSARELIMEEVRPNVWRVPLDEWHGRNPAVMDKIYSSGQVPTEFHRLGTVEEVYTIDRDDLADDDPLQAMFAPVVEKVPEEPPEEEAPAEEAPEEEPAEEEAPAEEAPEEEPAEEEPPEETPPPSVDWLKADLIAHAEGMDLDVNDHMTKQEILDLIESS